MIGLYEKLTYRIDYLTCRVRGGGDDRWIEKWRERVGESKQRTSEKSDKLERMLIRENEELEFEIGKIGRR